jgi:hypothetical protein
VDKYSLGNKENGVWIIGTKTQLKQVLVLQHSEVATVCNNYRMLYKEPE